MLVILELSACGSSPPTRFFALESTPPGTPVQLPSAAPVKVDGVHIPSVLDRRTIVRGEKDYQLSISSQDRWGADFGQMVRRVLTQDLQARLPAGMVVSPNAPASSDARGIVADILSFEPSGAAAVTLDVDWVLLQGSPAQPALQRSLHLSEPYDGSASSQAAAMSRLIGRLADDVAQGLRAQDPSGAKASHD
ncbi:MAG TPA: ABC-type transport auxiliary lipoprotein family protein [Steroidobacteraceae bacterium]